MNEQLPAIKCITVLHCIRIAGRGGGRDAVCIPRCSVGTASRWLPVHQPVKAISAGWRLARRLPSGSLHTEPSPHQAAYTALETCSRAVLLIRHRPHTRRAWLRRLRMLHKPGAAAAAVPMCAVKHTAHQQRLAHIAAPRILPCRVAAVSVCLRRPCSAGRAGRLSGGRMAGLMRCGLLRWCQRREQPQGVALQALHCQAAALLKGGAHRQVRAGGSRGAGGGGISNAAQLPPAVVVGG